ncbi:hypothetical protein A6V39_01520 [Candidatus Mycoplasma haematobovis]|uniref:Uncharacterized protein n=1 Tax=Candidatus Mycoplasma haematobovis TaxID=432608 RepID=A0A1A9QFH7_9MOLU|nr:hypothetical protein [Candidatus Mycoplasma haematobovis]OAL10725.1 hypothetical protein A6V39_01520 [Candidatus Mycoplasma haematobovis]
MFGPKSYERIIFEKTKEWWELLQKLHLPELRAKLTKEELKTCAFYMQELEIKVRLLQNEINTALEDRIDFRKLKRYFFRDKQYRYGKKMTKEELDDL